MVALGAIKQEHLIIIGLQFVIVSQQYELIDCYKKVQHIHIENAFGLIQD